MPKELTNKQQAFIQEYCSNGYNAAKAYKVAYPDCKAGHNALGARLTANDSIKQAVEVKKAEKQAEIDYNYDVAASELRKRLAYLEPQAKQGNIQAIQAQTAILRELNDITGLHKQTIQHKGEALPKRSEAEDRAYAEAARVLKIRLASG